MRSRTAAAASLPAGCGVPSSMMRIKVACARAPEN